jgi:hypothetical protein
MGAHRATVRALPINFRDPGETQALARRLGMPPESRLIHFPPTAIYGWKGWTEESFGRLIVDDELAREPWWPIEAGDPLPDRYDEWLWRLRRSGIGLFIERRRDTDGRWQLSIQGPDAEFRSETVRQLLPGLRLWKTVISRGGGRPRGRTKRSPKDVTNAIQKYRSATAKDEVPPAKWLARELGVSVETARKYLRRLKKTGGIRRRPILRPQRQGSSRRGGCR